jgi:SAM-dependent methyltransferase
MAGQSALDWLRDRREVYARELRVRLGIPVRLPHEDRPVLEQVILPYFAERREFATVLFVGCAWYTSHYARLFRHARYITIDGDPATRAYGAKEHLVARLEEISGFFAPGELDLIVCNGVFGWGLNAAPDVERAFEATHVCLRPGGVLLVGWNDTNEWSPFSLGECQALKRFSRWDFEPFGASRSPAYGEHRHIYEFFERTAAHEVPALRAARP